MIESHTTPHTRSDGDVEKNLNALSLLIILTKYNFIVFIWNVGFSHDSSLKIADKNKHEKERKKRTESRGKKDGEVKTKLSRKTEQDNLTGVFAYFSQVY